MQKVSQQINNAREGRLCFMNSIIGSCACHIAIYPSPPFLLLPLARFLSDFSLAPIPSLVSIERTTAQYGIERRRMYDVLNILEAIKVVVPFKKDEYMWHGRTKMAEALEELKRDANGAKEEEKYKQQDDVTNSIRQWKAKPAFVLASSASSASSSASSSSSAPLTPALPVRASRSSPSLPAAAYHVRPSLGAKPKPPRTITSLALLCRKFLSMFMVTTSRIVSQDGAGVWLVGGLDEGQYASETEAMKQFNCKERGEEEERERDRERYSLAHVADVSRRVSSRSLYSAARSRRLYDITNVFVAVGLIRRIHFVSVSEF